MTDDIVAFIRARLDEDEQDALNALRGYTPVTDAGLADWQRSARWRSSYQHVTAVHDIPIPADVLERGDIWTKVATVAHGNYPAAYHIARHDPARVLRGVEAKRRLVDPHHPDSQLENWYWTERSCAHCGHRWHRYIPGQNQHEIGPEIGCPTLSAVASEWTDHPDFRPEWTL